jgi:hypothetical protein
MERFGRTIRGEAGAIRVDHGRKGIDPTAVSSGAPDQGLGVSRSRRGTARSYGLEFPQPVIIGSDGRIVGFDHGVEASDRVVHAVLEDRITTTPPKKTRESLRAFSESGRVLLSPEPRPMHREADRRPDFSPSYTVHIIPAKDELGGGDYGGSDYWSLEGYTVKRLLAQMLDVNQIRIDLPASIDTRTRYDFSIVLPKPEDGESMRGLIRQGVEDHFHFAAVRENRLREVYVLTASDPKLPASTHDPLAGGGDTSSMGWRF